MRARIIALTMLAAFSCAAGDVSAQQSTWVDEGEKKTIRWDDMADRIVSVEGLAWGAHEKGIGQYLVLPHGRVYVDGIDFAKSKLNGGLVSVTGLLRKKTMKAAPKRAQGYSQEFQYFTIEALEVGEVKRVENDQLLPAKGDWIHVGLGSRKIVEIASRHSLEKVALQVRNRRYLAYAYGGETIYCVLDPKQEIVSRLYRIVPHGLGRADDEFIPIQGINIVDKK